MMLHPTQELEPPANPARFTFQMEFLYGANRFNVAISRAECVAVLVASPKVFEAECRTPRQMQIANAFLVVLNA